MALGNPSLTEASREPTENTAWSAVAAVAPTPMTFEDGAKVLAK
jgi:hypothetical protein